MRLLIPILSIAIFGLGCGDVPPLYEGMPDHVRERHVALEGAVNFRDLGGYRTRGGQTVKWRTFYRSDNLSELTEADLEKVSALGIKLVCDFRGPDEWQQAPDRLPADDPPEVAHLEIWDPRFTSAGFRERLAGAHDPERAERGSETGQPDPGDDLGLLLVEGNRLFASQFSDRYRAMVDRIRRPENLPALVHCTAGKDRAGFASALILRLLGVPMATIYEDFLLTNHYTAERIERAVLLIRLSSFFRADEQGLRSVLGVEQRFLEAAFDEIDSRYGSFDAYRREALGLSDTDLAVFRALALE